MGEFELFRLKATISSGLISSLEFGYRSITKSHLTITKVEGGVMSSSPEDLETFTLDSNEHIREIFYLYNDVHVWGIKATTSLEREHFLGPVTFLGGQSEIQTYKLSQGLVAGFCAGLFESRSYLMQKQPMESAHSDS